MKIYQPQVGLQGGPTKAQASYNSPVANAIGQSAGVASQFLEKYQQAQYARNKMNTVLDVKKRINDYQENLRANPVLPGGPDDDIVALKEENWQKFSSTEIANNVIGKIKDPKLREEMGQWWSNESENYRSSVVNNAMDENIAYMGQRTIEDVNTAIYEEQFGLAMNLAETALNNGIIGRETYDGISDQVALQSILKITGPNPGVDSNGEPIPVMSLKEAQQYIDESPLEADEKIKANKYMAERRKVHQADLDTAYDQYKDKNFVNIVTGITSGNIRTEEGLRAAYNYLPNAQLGDEVIPGSKDKFEAKTFTQMYGILRQQWADQKRAEKGDPEPDIPPDVLKELERIQLFGDREEMRDTGWDFVSKGFVTIPQLNDYFNKIKNDQNQRLKDPYAKLFTKGIATLIKDKVIDPEDEGRITALWNDHISLYSTEDQFKEKYNEDMDAFFKNLGGKAVSVKLSDLGAVSYSGDIGDISANEKLIDLQMNDKFVGIVNTSIAKEYMMTPSPDITALKERTSQWLYGKAYKDLDREDKKKTDMTLTVGEYGKILSSEADSIVEAINKRDGTEYEADPYIDHKGIPYVVINGQSYRMELNANKDQEVWKTYGADGKWYPVDDPAFKIIDIPKKQTMVGALFESISNTLNKPIEPTRAETAEKARVNTAKKLYELGFSGYGMPNVPTSRPSYNRSSR